MTAKDKLNEREAAYLDRHIGQRYVAELFEVLDDHTVGMTDDERVPFLANEMSSYSDDEPTMAYHRDNAELVVRAWRGRKDNGVFHAILKAVRAA